jgi:hypothetical protein
MNYYDLTKPNVFDADVYNYLNELMDNDCLS